MAKKESGDFKWLTIVNKLAGGDITKQKEVYKLNYIQSLNMLGFWKYEEEQKQTENK